MRRRVTALEKLRTTGLKERGVAKISQGTGRGKDALKSTAAARKQSTESK